MNEYPPDGASSNVTLYSNLFKFYLCCDPLTANWVESSDQMVPYLALDLFQNLPGLSGLYIAGAYCGALSTVSSGINSMSTVIVTDFIRPILQENKTERFYLWTAKILSVCLGLSSIAFAYMLVIKYIIFHVTISYGLYILNHFKRFNSWWYLRSLS